jgi:phosphatidylethanolamine-binding protein (PEBP) family uncharacterized protein
MIRVEAVDGKQVLLKTNQLSYADQRWLQGEPLEATSQTNLSNAGGAEPAGDGIAAAFKPFEKLGTIKTRSENGFFFIESNGLPSHQMMVGIKTWQQQVPLPQKYVGNNAWRVPLEPKVAAEPASTKGRFLRGAIAIGVNGIPIFNPLNNRGADSNAIGELDEWGGHCGRADDYHYHVAPVHLEETVGKGNPIAYGLDGYPIYGYTEPDGSPVKDLDECHGHKDAAGNYHYHAAKKYPYFIGAFRGEVVEKDGQVDPQPRAEGVRPDTRPLPGAKITGYEKKAENRFVLAYEQHGKPATVDYLLNKDGSVTFEFTDTEGKKTTETYTGRPRRGGPGGQQGPQAGGQGGRGRQQGGGQRPDGGRGGQGGSPRGNRPPPDDRPPPRGDRPPPQPGDGPPPPPPPPPPPDERPPRGGNPRGGGNQQAAQPPRRISSVSFSVASESVDEKGFLNIDCTCDGKRQTPEIHWGKLPEGTKSVAVSIWHTAPDQEKSYWVVYNIPADAKKLELNSKQVGKIGVNDKRQTGYDPPCSQGPGVKTYHISVFALSRELDVAPQSMNRAKLLESIADCTLAEGLLDCKVERKGKQ